MAIDLSGKNLRILLLTLQGEGKEPGVIVNNYIVSNAIMKGTGEQVSLHIYLFLKKKNNSTILSQESWQDFRVMLVDHQRKLPKNSSKIPLQFLSQNLQLAFPTLNIYLIVE